MFFTPRFYDLHFETSPLHLSTELLIFGIIRTNHNPSRIHVTNGYFTDWIRATKNSKALSHFWRFLIVSGKIHFAQDKDFIINSESSEEASHRELNQS